MFGTLLKEYLIFLLLHSSISPASCHLLLCTLSIWLAVGLAIFLCKLTGQKSGGTGLLTWHISLYTPFPLLLPLCPLTPLSSLLNFHFSPAALSSSVGAQPPTLCEPTPISTHFPIHHHTLRYFETVQAVATLFSVQGRKTLSAKCLGVGYLWLILA